MFFLFLFHFKIVLDFLNVVSELFHVVVYTGLDLILSLEFERAFTMRALMFTKVSFLCVQVNFWTCLTHLTLNVIRVLGWNFVANWFDGLV